MNFLCKPWTVFGARISKWRSIAAVLFLLPVVAAGQTPPTKTESEPVKLDTVTVTGSLIRGTDAETALPVSVITREQIQQSGVQNIEQLVQRISATQTAQSTRLSDEAGNSTYGLSSVSLRGLSELRTLVLINGRRAAVFAGTGTAVDLNSLPLSAIERVEILRDGASSSYGSDAVAGVVNFILRKDFEGVELTGFASRPTWGDGGGVTKYNFVMGKNGFLNGKASIMLVGNLDTEQTLLASNRDFSSSGNRPPFFSNAATPSGRIEGIYVPGTLPADNNRTTVGGVPGGTNPYGMTSSGWGNPFAPDTRVGMVQPDQCPAIGMYAAGLGGVDADGVVDPNGDKHGDFPNCNFDSAPFVNLFPKTQRYSGMLTGRYEFVPEATGYFEASYAHTQVTEKIQPAPVREGFLNGVDTAFDGSGVDPVLLIRPANPNYAAIVTPYLLSHGLAPMNGSVLGVTLRTFLTGLRTNVDTNEQVRFVTGLQGAISDWNYDTSLLWDESRQRGKVTDGFFSQLELARVLNDPASDWNPWGTLGAQPADVTAALQGAKYFGPSQTAKSRLASLEATVTHPIEDLPGGPLQFAAGINVRREFYTVEVPPILALGDIAGLGGATQSEKAQRTVEAVFGEINAPLTKQVEVNGSLRLDRYSDVGDTLNGKLSLRYQPFDSLLFRSSYGTGFRAPTLVELFQPVTLGTSEQFTDPARPADGDIQVNAVTGGNPGLKPEESRQFSLGTAWSPTKNFTFGVDLFWINIREYITSSSALALVVSAENGTPIPGGNVVFNPDGSVNQIDERSHNAGAVIASGLDVNWNVYQNIPFGRLSADFTGTYMTRFDLQSPGTPVQGSVGTTVDPLGNPLDAAVGGGAVSRWKHVLSGHWQAGPVTTTVVQNFFDGYRDGNDLNGNRHDVPSYSIFDAQVAFTGVPRVELAVGAQNVFQKKPPLYIFVSNQFQYGYDPSQYDARGRVVYARLTIKLF